VPVRDVRAVSVCFEGIQLESPTILTLDIGVIQSFMADYFGGNMW